MTRLRAMAGWGIGAPVVLSLTRNIRVHPRNLDRDLGNLDDLAGSIKAAGFRRPLLLRAVPRRGRELLDGHRHLAAAVLAGLNHLPCVVLADVDDRWLRRAARGLSPADARRLLIERYPQAGRG
ncbi:hypothetical protein SUDANB95_07901 (plasmid) [Actinosynnema sp. ALI-1.44]